MSSRPFAVFDIDGTIIRWQLYHAIADRLARQNIIPPEAFQKVRAARQNWKRRTGVETFKQYEEELVKAFTESLSGLPLAEFEKASDEVFDEYKQQVYVYSRDLITELKARNYLLFAISGSPVNIVRRLAEFYGFDDYAATEFIAKDSVFTGELNIAIRKKPQLLQELIDRHGCKLDGSIGVGDSEGDINMLAIVEQPVAFNPSRQLFDHARQQGWPIVIERKNVVYELRAANGEYKLETD